MRTIFIDCSEVTTEAALWQTYLRMAEPEGASYFGCNLDAFWDALNGGPGWPGEVELKFINTMRLKSFKEGRFHRALAKIAEDSKIVQVSVE